MVILETESSETFGDRFQARRLRLAVKVARYVRSVNDSGEQGYSGVLYSVLVDKSFEARLAFVVSQLHACHVERNCCFCGGNSCNVLRWNKQEFCGRINEPPDQPRAGDAINLY